jgi:hypothetical protein
VAHAYNPSYSGGRGEENHGSKPARQIVPREPILKNPITKKKKKKKRESMNVYQ